MSIKNRFKYYLIFSLLCLTPCVFANPQPVSPNGFMDVLYNDILGQTSSYQAVFAPAARSLLISLSLGEFVWDTSIRVLKGADSIKILAFVIVRIVSLLFVLYFIDNPDWVQNIISQGQAWAAQAGGISSTTTPSTIAGTGVTAVSDMMLAIQQDNGSIWSGFRNVIQGFIVACSGIAIMILFLLIGMQYLITLIESTLVISIGFVMMGFLGSSWTKQFGRNYISYVIAVSIKLTVTLMICGVVLKETTNWTNMINSANNDLGLLINTGFQLIIDSIVLLVMVRNTPAYAAGIISGVSSADASSMISSAAAVMMGAAAMMSGAIGSAKSGMTQLSSAPLPTDSDNGRSGGGDNISPTGGGSSVPMSESGGSSTNSSISPTGDAPTPDNNTSNTVEGSISGGQNQQADTSVNSSQNNNKPSEFQIARNALGTAHGQFQQVGSNTQVQAPSLGDKDHGL